MDITRIEQDNFYAFEPYFTAQIKKEIMMNPNLVMYGAFDEEAENETTGVIVGDPEEFGMTIRYLYVDESRRREGIGSFLLEALSQYCLMVEIEAFAVEYPETSELAVVAAFFDEAGFSKEYNPVREYSMRVSDVRKLKMFKDIDNFKVPAGIESFSQMKRAVLNAFSGELFRRGDTCLSKLLEEGPLDEDLSFAYVEDNKILAVVAASVDGKDVTLEWAYSDPEKYALLLPTIKTFASKISPVVGDDAVMHVMGMTEAADGLIEGIFKESISETIKWTTRELVF